MTTSQIKTEDDNGQRTFIYLLFTRNHSCDSRPSKYWPLSWSSCILQQTDGVCAIPFLQSLVLFVSFQSSAFCRAYGTTEDKNLSLITLNSFSLAFCQFSRLGNHLSDRSKCFNWDLRSLLNYRNTALRNLQFPCTFISCCLSIYLLYQSNNMSIIGFISGQGATVCIFFSGKSNSETSLLPSLKPMENLVVTCVKWVNPLNYLCWLLCCFLKSYSLYVFLHSPEAV